MSVKLYIRRAIMNQENVLKYCAITSLLYIYPPLLGEDEPAKSARKTKHKLK